MREDKPNQLDEKFAEDLLDAALKNYQGVEPMPGLEDRVLANLRRQSRAARPVYWNWTSAMIAAAAVLIFFAADHLIYHPVVSVPEANNFRSGLNSNPIVLQAKTGERVADGLKPANAFVSSRRINSSSRRQDLALNLNSRREVERASSSLQVDEVQITEIRLDDIVISGNDR
jgi:hypothetical protein